MTSRNDGAGLDIGIAFDLRVDFQGPAGAPDDLFEELDSEATIDAIAAALEAGGHRPRKMGGGRAFLERLLAEPPELVFNLAEGRGTRSREAHVPAACEMLGVAYTHSDPLTCALTLDKPLAKRVVAAEGVPVPRGETIADASELAGVDLRHPLIAKPAFEGSSIGVRSGARIEDAAELRSTVERLLAAYGQPVLVEEFCPGLELTVGVLGTGAGARVLGVMGIEPRVGVTADFVYSVEVKRDFEARVSYACPARVDAAVLREVERLALTAYRALGCRDVGRVDMRLDADGQPRFLEINPLPGLNPRSGDIVILAGLVGMSHAELIAAVVHEARGRMTDPS